MRVAIDARAAVFPEKTGIGYYTWHLLRRLPAADPATDYVAWYLNARASVGGPRHLLAGVDGVRERGTPIPATWFERLERFGLPRMEWLVGFDVLFEPNFVPPPSRSRHQVLTVHDLAFRRFPETAPHATARWLAGMEDALRRASRVIAVSEATKQDLLELSPVSPDRVAVIPHGVDRSVFRPQLDDEVARVLRRFGVQRPYLLSLGGIEPRKNLPSLLQAYARLDADLRPTLVVAGSGVAWNPEGPNALRTSLDRLTPDVRRGVVLTGYVSELDKVALLSGAEALVYPSRYEGFGLPVLEAMACGTPVVTSNRSALPEVAGDAGLLVDPDHPDAIAGAIRRLLTDDEVRADLRGRGLVRVAQYTWEATARRTAAVLHEAATD